MKRIHGVLLAILLLVLAFGTGCSAEANKVTTTHSPIITTDAFPSLQTIPSFDFDFDTITTTTNADDTSDAGKDKYVVTVYVSRAGKIHRISYCSGMKYYTAMSYDEAVRRGYDFCENCY